MNPSLSPSASVAPDAALARLRVGTAQIVSDAELLAKLALGRPLRVKLGVDPTSSDLHLGHTIPLQKLRQFQDLGHHAVLIIGDFTAMVGDPSGRSATRPQLTHEAVLANAETYRRQAFKVLDPERTTIRFNGEWFGAMTFQDVIRLNSRVTLQQMLQREDFKARVDAGHPVSLHELEYPLMQGWDSVMIEADVELGATDQLFNILVGRDLQRQENQPQQVAMLMPILEGLDGVQKMSKSLKNYIGVTDPPADMFGKAMSISDELMARWYPLLLNESLSATAHPMEAKKHLAARLVARFHSEAEASEALEDFNTRFSKRDLEHADLPEVRLAGVAPDIVSVVIAAYQQAYGLAKSRGEIRRLIEGGSVQVIESPLTHAEKQLGAPMGPFGIRAIEIKSLPQKILDPKFQLSSVSGQILKLDKTRAVRITVL